jgi:hypothetical protein
VTSLAASIVIEEGEQAAAIAKQPLLQGFRRIGFVCPIIEGIKESRYRLGVCLQLAALEPILIEGASPASSRL